jgi:hypothetical protein
MAARYDPHYRSKVKLSKPAMAAVSLAALLTVFVRPRPLEAQTAASISGVVRDASGSPVSGAAVKARSLETGSARSATTDDKGAYKILGLRLGPQEVTASKTGFTTAVRNGIQLQVGQQAVVDLKLEVGELSQQIVVSEQTPVVNTTTAPISGMVSEREIKDLPLNGRSFDNLITLNPGAINYSALHSPQTSTSNGNTFSVEGRRTAENLVLMNGVEYTGSSQLAITPGGVSGELLGIDAIREFNVLTDTYGAQYGKRAGAQVSVVTQSGSNSLHGSLFEFLRNSDLDARNFFDQGFVPPFRRNQFGGALGGPLKKNKLFLFGNYEGLRQSLGVSNVSVVPDDQARQGMLPNASGVYAPVPNLNPAILPYMSYWPQANGPKLLVNGLPSGTALAYNNPSQSIREDFGTLRADANLRAADTLTGAYTVDDSSGSFPQVDPLFASSETLRNQVASLQELHVFSPEILNTATLGFSRASFGLASGLLGSFPAGTSFVSGSQPGGIVIGGGVTTTGGNTTITSAGPNNAAGVSNHRNLFTYSDTVQMVKGRHQVTFGAWFQRMQDNEGAASRRYGQATFTSLTTFLQGTVSNFQIVPDPNELGWRSLFGAFFVEDSFRIRPNLTLQLGLRDEFTTGWNEVAGRGANYIADASGVLQTMPRVGSSVFTQNNAKHLLGPRAGLAWDVFGNGRTAVRAGFGVYYSLIDDLAFLINSLPPYNGSETFANTSLFSFTPILPNAPIPPSCGPGIPQPCTTYAPQGIQANAKTPAVNEWRFTIEQQLDRNTALRISYAGEFGYHGLLSVDPNSIPAQVCASASGCTAGGTGTARTTVAQGAQYIPVGTRPNPYLSGGFSWYTEGNSSYNALQIDVNRRLSRGFEMRANYTFSKSLDVNSALTGAQSNNQPQMVMDRNDLRRDWGPSALDVTHQASLSGTWQIPLRGRIGGGWELNGIATLLSGFPFTPQLGSNRSGDGDTRNPDRPSYNPGFTGPIVTGNPSQWFNPGAFLVPAAGTWGNVGRNVLTGPGLATLDTSLFRNFKVLERTTLEFRAEFFNILNHTNFGTPNATVFSGTAVNPSAGLITSTATTSRQIQFGLKLMF